MPLLACILRIHFISTIFVRHFSIAIPIRISTAATIMLSKSTTIMHHTPFTAPIISAEGAMAIVTDQKEEMPIFDMHTTTMDNSTFTNLTTKQAKTAMINNDGLEIGCQREKPLLKLTRMARIIYSLLMPIVCVSGSIGAMISVFIFTRRQMLGSSLSIYLAALSTFDFILLFCAAIIYPGISFCAQMQASSNGYYPHQQQLCTIFWRTSLFTFPISLMAQTASVWTVVAITVDRYLAVKYPLRKRAWCVPRKAWKIVICIGIFAVLFKMPTFFEISLNECGFLMKTALRDDRVYLFIYYTYAYLLFILVIPFLLIIFLNVRILIAITTANERRRTMSLMSKRSLTQRQNSSCSEQSGGTISSRISFEYSCCDGGGIMRSPNNISAHLRQFISIRLDKRYTKMAILIMLAFIAFNFLAGFNHVIEAFDLLSKDARNLLIPIGNFLVCLNSATNILIYSIFGRRFRQMFLAHFCYGNFRLHQKNYKELSSHHQSAKRILMK